MGRKTITWIVGALLLAASPALAGKKNGTDGKKAKVTICHIPPGNPDNRHTIRVAEASVDAHLAHGDVLGECGVGSADDPVVDPVVIEANAGTDIVVFEGDVVEVVGGATILSGDYDGNLVFVWTQVDGDPVDYESTSPPLFVDTTGAFGDLVFRLTVSTLDGSASASDEFTVIVEQPILTCESVITDLGVLDGYAQSAATGINDFGQIAGYCRASDSIGTPASFLWENGVMTRISPVGAWSATENINNSGTVPVRFKSPETAHLYEGGVLSTLGRPVGSGDYRAFAVNDSGLTVGWASLNGGMHAVIWENQEPVDVFRIDGFKSTVIRSVNNHGDMILWASNETMRTGYGFILREGVYTDLGVFDGFAYCKPIDLNDSGQVVGHLRRTDLTDHAFIWQDGVLTDLGTFGGVQSQAWAINEAGDVVGYATTADGARQAYLWQNGVMTDLNDLLLPECGWVLTVARNINNVGQVVGVGLHNGEPRGFLLNLP